MNDTPNLLAEFSKLLIEYTTVYREYIENKVHIVDVQDAYNKLIDFFIENVKRDN